MVFINKLDRERAVVRPHARPAQGPLRRRRSPRSSCPSARRPSFRGIADLLTDTAFIYEGGKATDGEIPDDMEALEHEVHDNLVEGIVVADDDLLERYLDGDVPSVEELERTLAHGVFEATRVPGRVRLGHRHHRHRPAGRLHLRDRPVAASTARRSRSQAGDADRRGEARPGRRPARLRVQDDRRPVRRPHLAVQGAVGHGPARRPPGQHPHGHRRAPARHLHASGARSRSS